MDPGNEITVGKQKGREDDGRLSASSLGSVRSLRSNSFRESVCRNDLLQFFDPNVLPGNIERSVTLFDAVNLQPDEASRMSFEYLFVSQVRDRFAVDPCLDVSTFGDDAELIPVAVFHHFMRLQTLLRRQPAATGRFSIDVAGFCTVSSARFDFALRTVNATELFVLILAVSLFGLRSNLAA